MTAGTVLSVADTEGGGILAHKHNEFVVLRCSSLKFYIVVFSQNYSENMLAHKDNQRWEKWNLENTAKLLQARFPKRYMLREDKICTVSFGWATRASCVPFSRAGTGPEKAQNKSLSQSRDLPTLRGGGGGQTATAKHPACSARESTFSESSPGRLTD